MDPAIKRIVNMLSAAKTQKQYDIAKSTVAHSADEYKRNFAAEIARQRIISTQGLIIPETYQHITSLIPDYIICNSEKYLVRVSAEEMLSDMHKNSLLQHARKEERALEDMDARGIVHFLPFMMNDTTARSILTKNLNIGLVNLGYNRDSLERYVDMFLIHR